MAVKTYIKGEECQRSVAVDDCENQERSSLVVATRPLKIMSDYIAFFSNDEYGIEIAQDASAGGVPEQVHNGIDDVLWTATDIVGGGKTTFDSAEQAYAGAQSIKVDNAPADDVFQLAKGADLDCNNYVSLSMWIYVDKDWEDADEVFVYGWDTGTGLQVGDALDLSLYFDFSNFDVWQKISIPLTDFGALATYTTLDALRFRQGNADGKAPKYYLDNIQFEQTGTPVEYVIRPPVSSWLHLTTISIMFVDALNTVLADSSMPSLSYNKILGLSALASGIVYQRENDGVITQSINFKQISDFIQIPDTRIDSAICDGTNTLVKLSSTFATPITLKNETNDNVRLIISEDLSGPLQFRVSCHAKLEKR